MKRRLRRVDGILSEFVNRTIKTALLAQSAVFGLDGLQQRIDLCPHEFCGIIEKINVRWWFLLRGLTTFKRRNTIAQLVAFLFRPAPGFGLLAQPPSRNGL